LILCAASLRTMRMHVNAARNKKALSEKYIFIEKMKALSTSLFARNDFFSL
jgi:hypothetical protein